ncbi:MAG: DUF4912 domain-containing protein [Synechococcus sp.]
MVSKSLSSLARLTLRQLRRVASDLGVALYSRKSKEELLDAISHRQEFSTPGTVEAAITLAELEEALDDAPLPLADTRVVFLPRDPQWAYVFWEISAASRQAAEAVGARQLCLRVSDVTGLQDGASHPHTLQEVVVDAHASEWYLPVPLSDRDYRVELGFRLADGGWYSLAFSAVARVPALHPSEQILDQFVPFSLEAAPISLPLPTPAETGDVSLHERLYQTATIRWRRLGTGSEAYQEGEEGGALSRALNDSGIGRWASGRSESGIGGVAPRQRAFWLVADAELIVYGATDPSATLTIGDEVVPLSADGTFRIQVPFRDGHQLYPIKAVAADGEQNRHITLQFNRSTPEDNTNTPEQAQAEWF